ncbi:MAG TPA: hypothetical protein VF171_08465 [Trueperaceae bacterium]
MLLTVVLAALLSLSAATAQTALGLQPPAKLYTLAPGESITQTLRVDNPASEPVAIRVYPGDWQFDAYGKSVFYPAGSLPQSASSWITFTPSQLDLESREHGEIRYTLTVPPGTAPGTYWGVLFAEGENPNPTPGETLASFRIRTGHTFYVEVAPVTSSGEIAGLFTTPPATSTDPYTFGVQYSNTGTKLQRLTGRIEVRDTSGATVATIPLDGIISLPGSTRTITAQLYGPLAPGDYTALVVLNYGDPTLDVAGEAFFTLDQPLAEGRLLFAPDEDTADAGGQTGDTQ